MSKTAYAKQCELIHDHYGPDNCCLCAEKAKVARLEAQRGQLRQACLHALRWLDQYGGLRYGIDYHDDYAGHKPVKRELRAALKETS